MNLNSKIVDIVRFSEIRTNILKNKKIVFTNGCFDVLHSGHITYLNKAAEYGDVLIVGLNSDSSVKRIKGPDRPLNNQEDRALTLSALMVVDFVIIFDEDTPLNLIKTIRPDVLIKGADYSIDEIVGAKETIENGGTVKTIELVEGKSSTDIIEKLNIKKKLPSISIAVPALNEAATISEVLDKLISCLNSYKINWELILINDGSSDTTAEIMERFYESLPEKIKFINRRQNKGLGYSIREAMRITNCEAFTWLPADGENEPQDLLKYLPLLNYVDIIIPFATNKGVRSIFRRIISSAYLTIINLSFGTMFNYTNGNIIYKKKILDKLELDSTSFFFQTETLMKAVRLNSDVLFAEVPIFLKARTTGKSGAFKLKNILKVCKDYLRLIFYIHIIDRFKPGT